MENYDKPIDPNNTYDLIKKDIAKIQKKLIDLLVGYGRKDIKLCNIEHPKYKIRGSIIYRLNSILFHQQFLVDEINKYQEIINNISENNLTEIMVNISYTAYYIFDDIIYNIISLYDYISQLICLFYFKNTSKKYTWNKMIRTIRNNRKMINNDIIINSLLNYNKILIDHLFDYRSELLHYNRDGSDIVIDSKIKNNIEIKTLTIKVPNMILKKVKYLKKITDIDNYTIIDISYFLIDFILKQIDQLLDNLIKDMVPKIKKK